MSMASALSNVFRNGPTLGPFQQRRERVATSDDEGVQNERTSSNINDDDGMEEGTFVNAITSQDSNSHTTTQQTSTETTTTSRSSLVLSSGSPEVARDNNNLPRVTLLHEPVLPMRRPRFVTLRSEYNNSINTTNNTSDSSSNSSPESQSSTQNDVESGDVSTSETDGLRRFTISAQRATVTLAELEEERELARRRSTACVLFALFILFRLWIMALQEADMGLFLVCLIGTSWTARWISHNREQEEELDRRIANYIENSNNQNSNTENGGINRNDLRLLSFQAQLALAIMESQRQMMEGGYGHPDGEHARSTGVSDVAKAKWDTFVFKPDKHKNLVAKGLYGSVSLREDDDDDLKKPSASGGVQDEEPHCSICLGEYEEGEKLTKLTCGHLFHEECISSWCSNHTRCPLCNYDLNSVVTKSSEAGNANADEMV